MLFRRAADAGKPIQMCDALSRNLPKALEVLLANCLGHARHLATQPERWLPWNYRDTADTLADP